MREMGRTTAGRSNDGKDEMLRNLEAIFTPHVKEVVAAEARKRTLAISINMLSSLAMGAGFVGSTGDCIIERALLGESQMIVREWALLLREHAIDAGRTLCLATLDSAMLPPFHDDLARIFKDCCGRRMGTFEMTRDVLRRVRAELPEGETLPADATAFLRGYDIDIV